VQPERADQAGLLGDGDELDRRHMPSVGGPARERFERHDATGGELDDRLEVDVE
jgi:hypothetical protein